MKGRLVPVIGLIFPCWVGLLGAEVRGTLPQPAPASVCGAAGLNQPIAVYNNWSAYDELSDNIELTEELAMKQLGEILRLRRAGVRIDYYGMDAFWYSPTDRLGHVFF